MLAVTHKDPIKVTMGTVAIAPQERALLLQTANVGILIIFISTVMKYVLFTKHKSQTPCDASKLRPLKVPSLSHTKCTSFQNCTQFSA